MMKVLVTGATGFIGYHVARYLKKNDIDVVALVRQGSDSSRLSHLGVRIAAGDVRDYPSVIRALEDCRQIYHLAADYRLWVPDPSTMYAVNVDGARNIMIAARETGVEKIIYTSSVGALATSLDGTPSNEESPVALGDMTGHYKRSKFIAEREVYSFIEKGLPVVIVSPSTPVGPMDTRPTPTGKIIVDFLNGKMPAYLETGLNFVDVEDVACGHWLAACHGRIGEKYILGNRNMRLGDFLGLLAASTGKKGPIFKLPYLPVLAAAYVNEAVSAITKRPPFIPLTGVKMARKFMYFDCSKAVRELKMPQSPIENALEKAIEWFNENGYILKGRAA
jgi:dihydroflavonol-4-reductase